MKVANLLARGAACCLAAALLMVLHAALTRLGLLGSGSYALHTSLPPLIRPTDAIDPHQHDLHAHSPVHESFARYDPSRTHVPAWVIRLSAASSPAALPARATNKTTPGAPAAKQQPPSGRSYRSLYRSTLHRFFDSSPFSPSGRFLAVTRVPAPQPAALLAGKVADIFVVDLHTGAEVLVARTAAWGAQLGAQLQWGASDGELLFNQAYPAGSAQQQTHPDSVRMRAQGGSLGSGRHARTEGPSPRVLGVAYDAIAKTSRTLGCPVYHVSPDGRFSVSPNLHRIRYTQYGYGVDYDPNPRRAAGGGNSTHPPGPLLGAAATRAPLIPMGPATHASKSDGLFFADIETGQCYLLVSLHQFCRVAGLDAESTPTYGFHAKWSPDGGKVLFVVRTMERARGLQGMWGHRVRRQHLFVVQVEGRVVRHVTSWSSRDYAGSSAGAEPRGQAEADGNHPSWVAGTNLISMNARPASGAPFGRRPAPPGPNTGAIPQNSPLSHGQHALYPHWQLVFYDAAAILSLPSNGTTRAAAMAPREVFFPSSGHPNFSPQDGGRYALLDVYAKERLLFAPFGDASGGAGGGGAGRAGRERPSGLPGNPPSPAPPAPPHGPGTHAPLRLVDSLTGREVWILSLQLVPDPVPAGVTGLAPSLPPREARAWRCDMHPSWSRDHEWVALTGRPLGRGREVIIAYLGKDLSRFFPDTLDAATARAEAPPVA